MKKMSVIAIIAVFTLNQFASAMDPSASSGKKLISKIVENQMRVMLSQKTVAEKSKLIDDAINESDKILEKLEGVSDNEFSNLKEVGIQKFKNTNSHEMAENFVRSLPSKDVEAIASSVAADSEEESLLVGGDMKEIAIRGLETTFATNAASTVLTLKAIEKEDVVQSLKDSKEKMKGLKGDLEDNIKIANVVSILLAVVAIISCVFFWVGVGLWAMAIVGKAMMIACGVLSLVTGAGWLVMIPLKNAYNVQKVRQFMKENPGTVDTTCWDSVHGRSIPDCTPISQ